MRKRQQIDNKAAEVSCSGNSQRAWISMWADGSLRLTGQLLQEKTKIKAIYLKKIVHKYWFSTLVFAVRLDLDKELGIRSLI